MANKRATLEERKKKRQQDKTAAAEGAEDDKAVAEEDEQPPAKKAKPAAPAPAKPAPPKPAPAATRPARQPAASAAEVSAAQKHKLMRAVAIGNLTPEITPAALALAKRVGKVGWFVDAAVTLTGMWGGVDTRGSDAARCTVTQSAGCNASDEYKRYECMIY